MAASLVPSSSSSSIYISDWSSLPRELLDSVLDKLESLADYFRFRSVCVHWHSVASEYRKYSVPIKSPHLLIPDDNRDDGRIPFTLYRIADRKTLNSFSIPSGKCLIGSSFGWLIFINKDLVISLFNPFSMFTVIDLPPITFMKEKPCFIGLKYTYNFNFTKVILSADPQLNPEDYVVAILFQGNLAFMKPGSKNLTWTTCDSIFLPIEDVIYFNHQFHAVSLRGPVITFDGSFEKFPKFNHIIVNHKVWDLVSKDYLVHSCLSGKMLLVRRYDIIDMDEVIFEVYEMVNHNDKFMNWAWKGSLDEEVLFVGYNHSVSVLASDFPECLPGSIYFSDIGFGDMGIYHVGYQMLQPYGIPPVMRRTKTVRRRRKSLTDQRHTPIWFFPNISG